MSDDGKTASGLDATMSAPGTGPRASRDDATAPRSLDAPLAPGATLGRYVLVEALGAGGMGMVFRARDPDLGREVAVKVLRAGDGTGGSLERRLLREAQAMATVSHDNLANVFDIGTAGGRVFIAMELVDGGTLRALFADPAKTWRDKLAAVVSAGRGLAAAHSAGVIHRDFKPDNVLIAKNGRVKVVDFGLARADRSPDATETADGTSGSGSGSESSLPADLSAQLTQTGALLGTPAYMAPEQHAGDQVDARSDQFGFAVTAWEAVYGQRPFASDAYSSLVSAVRAHLITPPPKVAGVPPALEVALRRALSPEPSERFTSMDAALDAITAAIAPRRSRAPLYAAVASAVLVGGGVATYLALASRDRPPRRVVSKLGSASNVRVAVIPFDLSNLDEFSGDDEDRDDAAIERMTIQQTLSRHGEELGACYEEAGLDRAGRLSIQFTIDAKGRVVRYDIRDNDFPNTSLASCIGAKAMRWTFPAPKGGAQIEVTYPFEFSTDVNAGSASASGFDPAQIGRQMFGSSFPFAGGELPDLMSMQIDEVDDDHFQLPRALAAAIIADPDELPHGARFEPVRRGKLVGYAIQAIREDSVYDELNLKDGDVITSLAGIALTSPEAAERAIAAAKTASRIEVELMRDGDSDEPVHLSIDVMPDGVPSKFPTPPTPPAPPAPPP